MLSLRVLSWLSAASVCWACQAIALMPEAQHMHAPDAVTAPVDKASTEHTHEHAHDTETVGLRLNDGARWAVDAPLIEGMNAIRDAVSLARAAAPLDQSTAATLASSVEQQINFLIRNCALSPDADTVLHVLIGQLLSAASAVRHDPTAPGGLPKMVDALAAYALYFAHPNWQPLHSSQ